MRALKLDLVGKLVAHIPQRFRNFGRDFDHAQQGLGEPAFDGLADRALRQGKGGIGDRLVGNVLAGQVSERDVLLVNALFLGEGQKIRALIDALPGGTRFVHSSEGQLLDGPLFRCAVLFLDAIHKRKRFPLR